MARACRWVLQADVPEMGWLNKISKKYRSDAMSLQEWRRHICKIVS